MSSCCGQRKTNENPSKESSSCCNSGNVIVYSCSGGSRIGQIANDTAVLLKNLGVGNMKCITCVALLMNSHVETAKNAQHIVAIDGCKVGCVRLSLEKAEIDTYHHIIVADHGISNKSEDPDNKADVAKIANVTASLLKQAGAIE